MIATGLIPSAFGLVLGLGMDLGQATKARWQGYQNDIPPAATRNLRHQQYRLASLFPRFHVVEEGTGGITPEILSLFSDTRLRTGLEQGVFTSLQVRDLHLQINRINKTHTGSTSVVYQIPFVISLKHRLRSRGINLYQGTLEVFGMMRIRKSDTHDALIEVSAFSDSQMIEYWGRYLGYQDHAHLQFAQSVVPPVVRHLLITRVDLLQEVIGIAETHAAPVEALPSPIETNRLR